MLVQAMLPYMPECATCEELVRAVEAAEAGPAVAFQDDMRAVIAKLHNESKRDPQIRLTDLADGQLLHDTLYRLCKAMFANGIGENVIKTGKHDLPPPMRSSEAYMSIVAAWAHRTFTAVMTDAHFTWASVRLGHNNPAGHGAAQEESDLQLPELDLSEGGLPLLESAEDQKMQELRDAAARGSDPDVEDPDADCDGDDDDTGCQNTEGLQLKVRDIGRLLRVGIVIEVLFAMAQPWPALVMKLTSRTVLIRWLCTASGDDGSNGGPIFIDESLLEEPWPLKLVTNAALDVEELVLGSSDERRWRRLDCDSTDSVNSAEQSSSSRDPGSSTVPIITPAKIDVPARPIFGRAGQRRSDAATLSDDEHEYFSDAHLANTHAADERPEMPSVT